MNETRESAGAPAPQAIPASAMASGLAALRTPWPWGWNILGVGILFQALNFGVAISSFTFFVERWTGELGVARSEIMLAATLGAIGPALLGPVAGRAMDMLPARRVVAGGLLALILGLALMSQVTRVWQIVLIYALILPFSATFAGAIPAQVLAARWFPARRGFAIGLVATGLSLGGVIVAPITVALIEVVGWRSAYIIFALVTAFVLLPLSYLVIRSSPEGEDPQSAPDARAAKASGSAHTLRSIVMERNFWVLFIFLFPMGTALSVIQFNLAGLSAERGISFAQAGALISIMSMMLLAAKFLWGYLADRVEHRRLLCAAAAGNLVGCALLSFAGGFWSVCAALVVVGLSTGGILPLTGAVLAHQFGPAFGRAFGLVTMSLPLTLVGPPIAARLQEAWGSYDPVLLAAALFVGGSILAGLFLQTKPLTLARAAR